MPETKMIYTKAFVEKVNSDEEGVLEAAVASTPIVDRQGEVIEVDGWETDKFLANPVMLWAHNLGEMRPPIGKVTKVWRYGQKLMFGAKFDLQDDFAAAIFRKFKDGFLNAFSVGFMPLERDGNRFVKSELLEISAVPVPANPDAVVQLRAAGIVPVEDWSKFALTEDAESKTVIPFKATPLAGKDEEWDAGEEVRTAEVDDLKVMATWVDSESSDLKTSYKLPHHRAGGEHATVWRAVTAAMAALLGARGGVDVPEGDRQGIYNHLAKHYKEFDEEAPEFRMVEEQVLKGFGRELDAIYTETDVQTLKATLNSLRGEIRALKNQTEKKAVTKEDLQKALVIVQRAVDKSVSLRDATEKGDK